MVSDTPAGDGKIANFFYSVEVGCCRVDTGESIAVTAVVTLAPAVELGGGGGVSPPRISTAGNCDKDNKRNNNCPPVLPLSIRAPLFSIFICSEKN